MIGAVMFTSWGLVEILIAVIIIAACLGIAMIAVKASGIAIPPWFIQILWIVVVAVVAIVAIRFVAGL